MDKEYMRQKAAATRRKKASSRISPLVVIEDALGERMDTSVVIRLVQDPEGDTGDYLYVMQQRMENKIITEGAGEDLQEAAASVYVNLVQFDSRF